MSGATEAKLPLAEVVALLNQPGWHFMPTSYEPDMVPVKAIAYWPSEVRIALDGEDVKTLPTLEVYQTSPGRLSFRYQGHSRHALQADRMPCQRVAGILINPQLRRAARVADNARREEARRPSIEQAQREHLAAVARRKKQRTSVALALAIACRGRVVDTVVRTDRGLAFVFADGTRLQLHSQTPIGFVLPGGAEQMF